MSCSSALVRAGKAGGLAARRSDRCCAALQLLGHETPGLCAMRASLAGLQVSTLRQFTLPLKLSDDCAAPFLAGRQCPHLCPHLSWAGFLQGRAASSRPQRSNPSIPSTHITHRSSVSVDSSLRWRPWSRQCWTAGAGCCSRYLPVAAPAHAVGSAGACGDTLHGKWCSSHFQRPHP